MKKLLDPNLDKAEGQLTLNAATTVSDSIPLYGFERTGTIIITWGGAGAMALDILVSAKGDGPAERWGSLLPAALTSSMTISVTSINAEWIMFDGAGTVWGADDMNIDYQLKTCNPT